MLESVWQSIRETSGRRWITTALTPAICFWAVYALVYYGLWVGVDQTLLWWESLQDGSRALLLAATVLPIGLTALALQLVGPGFFMIARGDARAWASLPFIGRWLYHKRCDRWRRFFSMHHARGQMLLQRVPPHTNSLPTKPLTSDEREELGRIERVLHDAPQQHHLPIQQQRYMPTRLGNMLRAAEEDQVWRYGLDPVIVWPRLFPLLPESFRSDISDAQAKLEGALYSTALALIFSVIWLGVSFASLSWIALSIAIGGTIMVYLLGYMTLRMAVAYAEGLRVAFDLYRFELYKALHLPLPSTTKAELTAGQDLTAALWRGASLSYEHPPTKS